MHLYSHGIASSRGTVAEWYLSDLSVTKCFGYIGYVRCSAMPKRLCIDLERLRELREVGKSLHEIAHELNCSHLTVSRLCKKYGILKGGDRWLEYGRPRKIDQAGYFSKRARAWQLKQGEEYLERKRIKDREFRASDRGQQAAKIYRQRPERKAAEGHRRGIRRNRLREINLSEADKMLCKKIRLECPKDYHTDHIYPLSKGGAEHPWNLQNIPAKLNLQLGSRIKKNTTPLLEIQPGLFTPIPDYLL